jgi:DNA polymerase I-like protein with 3'-5' exonuclease and polymerase domains
MIDSALLKPLILSELKPPMNVTLVTPDSGLAELSGFIAEKLATRGILGLDTETNWCNDFFFRKVRTIQVGDKEKQFVIDLLPFAGSSEALSNNQGRYTLHECFKPIFDILSPALCDNKVLKVGQNLAFEYIVLYWGFGQRIWHLYSTDLAERVIQAGAISLKKMSEFSMASIVARRFGMLVDKTEQEGFDLETPLTFKQIEYAAFDTRMPLSMREHQLREMTVDMLLATSQIENDALGSYADMHLNGMLNDGPRWMKRIDAVLERRQGELKILDVEFLKLMGHKTEQIDFVELKKREDNWRNNFETPSAAEMAKAEEIRFTRDNAQKAVLREELKTLKSARAALKQEARKHYSELSKQHTVVKNNLPKCEGEAYINYGSNDQLLAALKKMPGMKTLEGAGDEHLLKYNDRPFIQTLRKYRKGKKDTGTYGKQWTETWITKPCKEEGWVHPYDGRIHASFNQLEAETGRSSCSKPNMQNLPAVDEVRACFICDPPDEGIRVSNCCEADAHLTILSDNVLRYICEQCKQECLTHAEEYVLVTTDMAGAELCIIAEMANATSWITAFAKGWDVHSVSTEILEPVKWAEGGEPNCAYFKLDAQGNQKRQKCECPKHVALRKRTKAVNFLLCYGGGPDALADELDITVEQAKELMKNHEAKFPDVWNFLKKSGEKAQRTNEARDLYGRRRLLPAPTWESSKEYFKDEHADRLELDEEVQKQNIFNFKAAYLREPTELEKYKLTHREPNDYEIKSAMRGLHGSIGRRGKNHCIQGSNASIIKRAMGCGFDKDNLPFLWHSLKKYKAKLLSMVHDELIVQCPKRFGKVVAQLVADAFRRAAAEVMSKVEMKADYHIADRWQK